MTRWRDRPRRRVLRWDAPRGYLDVAALPVILAIGGVVALGQAVFGDVSAWSRFRLAAGGLTLLAAAVAIAWFVVLWLRRPVVPEDERTPEPTPPEVSARADAERTARDHRLGSGF